MISYRQAYTDDARSLLMVRRESVLSGASVQYGDKIVSLWAPSVDNENVEREKNLLQSGDRLTIAAVNDESVIGFITLGISEALIKQCYVSPEYNGHGIGGKLIDIIEQVAYEVYNIKELQLSAALNSVNFYKHKGFEALKEYDYELGDGTLMKCLMMRKNISINDKF